jgi:hypothetical protein
MVDLKKLFNLLATGEFSNIALSREDSGAISEEDYDKVVGHLNLGIVEIYKRFEFLHNELKLHVDPSVETYYLRPERVADLHNITLKAYIERPEDGEGCLNIVKVTNVYDVDGNEYTINNRFKSPAIIQPAHDVLKITNLETAAVLSIVYQAYPDLINLSSDFDLDDHVLYIPEIIVEPLLYYIASRVYKPTGSNDSTANADKSAGYQQQYELACQKIGLFGLDPQHDNKPNDFEEDGWV